jgi:flagellar protein FliS
MSQNVASYQTTGILGKSSVDLVIKVYDGAIDAFRSAREHYDQESLQDGFDQIENARRFLVHLYTTLDPEQGGEIAENLGKLYAHVINRSFAIQGTKDLGEIDDSINILSNLRSGWVGLRDQQVQENGLPPTTPRNDSFSASA